MARVRKKRPKKSAAKKRWVQILAPKIFNQRVIGETHVFDAREGIGKTLTVNLMTLTKNPKTQGINVSFVVNGQHDGKLLTGFTGFKVMSSVVRRMVRRGRNKIEDSFVCLTSDGKKIRMKPIVITRSKAKGSVLTALRKELRRFLVKTAARTTYEQLAADIVERKLQKSVYGALSGLYPVVNCEMRWFRLLTRGAKTAENKEGAEAVEEPKEEFKEEAKEEVKEEAKPPAPKEEKKEMPEAQA